MDVVSNEIMVENLAATGAVAVLASEEVPIPHHRTPAELHHPRHVDLHSVQLHVSLYQFRPFWVPPPPPPPRAPPHPLGFFFGGQDIFVFTPKHSLNLLPVSDF